MVKEWIDQVGGCSLNKPHLCYHFKNDDHQVQVIISNVAAAGKIKRSSVSRGESKTSQRQINQKHLWLLAFQKG